MSSEHRIIGPPGTGKTWTLTRYAERGAERYGADGVAIASLTKAAAQEIRGRAAGIPKRNVGTLHAHAYRALEQPELAEIPEALHEWNRHVENIAPALRVRAGAGLDGDLDFQGDALATVVTEGEQMLADLSTRRARLEDPDRWPSRVRRFAELWADWKRKAGRLDFTDLIERALRDLDELPGAPKVLLLDEAQDLSALEFAFARTMGQHVEQFVVCGDPDQNLYAWRGADPDAFWAGEAASERVIEESRRVPRAVLEYALDWIRGIPGRRDVAYRPRLEDPDDQASPVAEGEVRHLGAERQLAPTFVRPGPLLPELLADLDQGRTVMVLASCAYMLEPLARELREAGVPFHNPYRPKHGGWNPLRGAERPLAFLRPQRGVWGDEARPWTWDDLGKWAEPLEARGTFTRGAKSMIESKRMRDLLGERPEADAEVPFGALFSTDRGLLLPESFEPVAEGDLDWWESRLLASHARRYAYPCQVARRQGAAALRDRPRLVLGTIHSVKGGEADSVYVFPDLSRAACQAAPAGGPPPITDAVRRLFYVAFTRARERLTVLEAAGAEYAALPRPGGGTLGRRPTGRRLGALLKADLSGGGERIRDGRQPTEGGTDA